MNIDKTMNFSKEIKKHIFSLKLNYNICYGTHTDKDFFIYRNIIVDKKDVVLLT